MDSLFLTRIQERVGQWRAETYPGILPETANILSHIQRVGFLHRPQIEALETYIYLKEVGGNKTSLEIFKDSFPNEKELIKALGVPVEQQLDLVGDQKAQDRLLSDKFEASAYPNQVYALTMGSGKTILMATFMVYDFILSYYHPDDIRFGKNVLIFAPDTTIIESLKEIKAFDYTKIVPKEYQNVLLGVKYHYLEDTKSALTPIGNYNVVVTNSQKIILKTRRNGTATKSLFTDVMLEEKQEVENQRLHAIRNLNGLLIFVDEAHHTYGQNLEGALKKTRQTIGYIHGNTPLKGVINLTGTPYVNNTMITDVVYHFGLKQGIEQGILKQVRFFEYSNVKNDEFIDDVIGKFWAEYGENRLEDKLPKIAFYAADIEDLKTELRPKLELALSKRGIALEKVLEYHTEAEEQRDVFNALDTPESPRQFILLVGKGTEGWNCRSLVSCALFRRPRSSIFVLQSSTRCLRSIGDNSTVASVFLSNENYRVLDRELKNNFNASIQEISGQDQKTIEHTLQIEKRKTLTVRKELTEIVAVANQSPEEMRIDWNDFDASKYTRLIAEGGIFLGAEQEARLVTTKAVTELLGTTRSTYYDIVTSLHGSTHLPCLVIDQVLLQDGRSRSEITRQVNERPELLLFLADRLLVQAYRYEEKREVIQEEIELTKAYPFKLSVDQRRNALVVYREDEEAGRLGFHINPYNFDSADEKDLFRYMHNVLEVDEAIVDVYFTGGVTDSTHNDFYVEYYNPEQKKVARYFPDFLVETTKGRRLVIEVKGTDKRLGYERNRAQYTGKLEDLFDEVFAKELGFKEFQKLNAEFEYKIVFDASLQARQQELLQELKALG